MSRGPDWHRRTGVVDRHPALEDLGRDPAEQRRVQALARDLAAWFAGAPRRDLAVLGRVVTAVGGASLRDTRVVCLGVPLLAVEAGARATAVLWPLLRDPWTPPPPPEPEPPGDEGRGDDGDPEDDAAGSGGGSGDGGGESAEPSDATDSEGAEASGAAEADDEDGEPRDPEADARDVLAALADGLDTDDPELDTLAEALARLEDDAEDALSDRLAPVGEAAWDSAQEVEQVARSLSALVPEVGWGASPGRLHPTLGRQLEALTDMLRQLPELREIADALGRAEADEPDEAHEPGGSEEVTGVHLGGEIHHALPAELALLGDEDTEDLFYQRLVEHRLVSLELAGAGVDGVAAEQVRGPVLACIDTSGSMAGAPEAVAKALVLAVARRVLPQGRPLHLLLFGARGEHTELRLRRGHGGLEDLLDFLTMGFEGGTDFDTPLVRALELLEEQELAKADILVVTDGFARAAPEVIRAVDHARTARSTRVWSTVIGRGGVAGVSPFSDQVWTVDPDADGVALTRRR